MNYQRRRFSSVLTATRQKQTNPKPQEKPVSKPRTKPTAHRPKPPRAPPFTSPHHDVPTNVPRYFVDLDAPERERWHQVGRDYSELIRDAMEEIKHNLGNKNYGMIRSFACRWAKWVLSLRARSGGFSFSEEVLGLTQATGLPLEDLMLLQVLFDFSGACTSIVHLVRIPGGGATPEKVSPCLIRTFDSAVGRLRNLVIEVQATKGGARVWRSTTFAGYLGVLTGIRFGSYAIALNLRTEVAPTFQQGVARLCCPPRKWLGGILLRDVLTRDLSFEEAYTTLAETPLVGGAYFTLVGQDMTQCAIITRDPMDEIAPLTGPSLVQTNTDHWELKESRLLSDVDIPAGKEFHSSIIYAHIINCWARYAVARGNLPPSTLPKRPKALWEIAGMSPITNADTIYTASAIPALDDYTSVAFATGQLMNPYKQTSEIFIPNMPTRFSSGD